MSNNGLGTSPTAAVRSPWLKPQLQRIGADSAENGAGGAPDDMVNKS